MNTWWKIWWWSLAAKLALAANIPLTPDEAYYWVWTQHPQLSYFDHPPAIAWLLTLGDWLPTWAVRWPAILLAHCSLWFWTRLTDDWLNRNQQLLFLCLLLLMPLIGIGSLIATPDLPLLFSWSFSLWALNRILAQNAKISDAALFGLALGLGGLSKYHIILLLPIAAFVWWRTPNRPALHRWLPITLAVAVLVSSPVWIWNIQNDWASFRFQLDHGLGRKVWKPSWTSEYLLAQIGLLFPIVVWLAIKSTAPLLLRVAAWFPLIFFFFTSFRGYVEANWPIVAHPLVLALAVSQLYAYRRSLQITAAFWAALLAILLGLLAVPGWPAWTLKTKLRDLHQYDTLRTVSLPLEPLYARSYQMASILSFSQQRKVYKLRGMNRRDFFDTLPGSSPTHDTIYLAVNRGDMLPEPWTLWKKTNVTPVDDQFEIWELHRP